MQDMKTTSTGEYQEQILELFSVDGDQPTKNQCGRVILFPKINSPVVFIKKHEVYDLLEKYVYNFSSPPPYVYAAIHGIFKVIYDRKDLDLTKITPIRQLESELSEYYKSVNCILI